MSLLYLDPQLKKIGDESKIIETFSLSYKIKKAFSLFITNIVSYFKSRKSIDYYSTTFPVLILFSCMLYNFFSYDTVEENFAIEGFRVLQQELELYRKEETNYLELTSEISNKELLLSLKKLVYFGLFIDYNEGTILKTKIKNFPFTSKSPVAHFLESIISSMSFKNINAMLGNSTSAENPVLNKMVGFFLDNQAEIEEFIKNLNEVYKAKTNGDLLQSPDLVPFLCMGNDKNKIAVTIKRILTEIIEDLDRLNIAESENKYSLKDTAFLNQIKFKRLFINKVNLLFTLPNLERDVVEQVAEKITEYNILSQEFFKEQSEDPELSKNSMLNQDSSSSLQHSELHRNMEITKDFLSKILDLKKEDKEESQTSFDKFQTEIIAQTNQKVKKNVMLPLVGPLLSNSFINYSSRKIRYSRASVLSILKDNGIVSLSEEDIYKYLCLFYSEYINLRISRFFHYSIRILFIIQGLKTLFLTVRDHKYEFFKSPKHTSLLRLTDRSINNCLYGSFLLLVFQLSYFTLKNIAYQSFYYEFFSCIEIIRSFFICILKTSIICLLFEQIKEVLEKGGAFTSLNEGLLFLSLIIMLPLLITEVVGLRLLNHRSIEYFNPLALEKSSEKPTTPFFLFDLYFTLNESYKQIRDISYYFMGRKCIKSYIDSHEVFSENLDKNSTSIYLAVQELKIIKVIPIGSVIKKDDSLRNNRVINVEAKDLVVPYNLSYIESSKINSKPKTLLPVVLLFLITLKVLSKVKNKQKDLNEDRLFKVFNL
jgi:hypothetical protein